MGFRRSEHANGIPASGSVRHRRRRGWWSRALALLLLFLAADYCFYPLLSRPGGRSFNQGENGLWLRYRWYFGQRSDEDVSVLARRLRERQIRYAYFHVRHITRDGRLRYHYPDAARRLVAALHREAPSVKVIAWVYAGNARLAHTGVGDVDLANEQVRNAMVGEARWLVTECGFDGVQWDYEICEGGDPHFLRLMQETRAALPKGTLLSAAVPMWLPVPFGQWGWSEEYFAQVAATCDQLAVMAYDSGLYLPRAYVWLVRQQVVHVTQAVARGNPHCRVLIGVPTYGKGPPSHHAHSENIRLAVKGIREGLVDPRADRSVFAGVAPFAEYTTQPEEWKEYQELWLERAEGRLLDRRAPTFSTLDYLIWPLPAPAANGVRCPPREAAPLPTPQPRPE
jgi:hypothetical protein